MRINLPPNSRVASWFLSSSFEKSVKDKRGCWRRCKVYKVYSIQHSDQWADSKDVSLQDIPRITINCQHQQQHQQAITRPRMRKMYKKTSESRSSSKTPRGEDHKRSRLERESELQRIAARNNYQQRSPVTTYFNRQKNRSLLTSKETGNRSDEMSSTTLVKDCQRMEIRILQPSNQSPKEKFHFNSKSWELRILREEKRILKTEMQSGTDAVCTVTLTLSTTTNISQESKTVRVAPWNLQQSRPLQVELLLTR